MIDSMKYHLIPHISQLKTIKEIYEELKSPFDRNNPSGKRYLRNKIQDIKMTKVDTVTPFFMKIS